MDCAICGQEKPLMKVLIEKAPMMVCSTCSRYGTALAPSKQPAPVIQKKFDLVESVADDYPSQIKTCREQLQLSQKDFAFQIQEKESVIHALEQGKLIPDLALARKLERTFHLKLITHEKIDMTVSEKKSSDVFTLGDLLKKKQ